MNSEKSIDPSMEESTRQIFKALEETLEAIQKESKAIREDLERMRAHQNGIDLKKSGEVSLKDLT